jgi:polyisoprenoid-binding protein YceI
LEHNNQKEMNVKQLVIAAAVLLLFVLPGTIQAEAWTIDPAHSSAQFSVRHMMVSTVRGEFTRLSGTVELDEKDVTRSSVEATIDATTIDTRNERRDGHLKSADFFDVANHPTITFKSAKVDKASDGRLKVTGDLTIRGVTRPVVLDVEALSPVVRDPQGNLRSGTSATTRINRKDFGVSWSANLDGGGLVVSDDVNITIDIELVKKAAPSSGASK